MGCTQSVNETTANKTTNDEKIIKPNKTTFKGCTYENTPEFNGMFSGKIMVGRVVDIYDGDTITCVINIFGGNYLFHIRLGDIDTCEMKSKSERAKDLAFKARKRMYQLITKIEPREKNDIDLKVTRKDLRNMLQLDTYLVNILCGPLDKYGRLLGWIFDISDSSCHKSNSYNHKLIREKLAYEYNGSTKLTEMEQIDLLSVN